MHGLVGQGWPSVATGLAAPLPTATFDHTSCPNNRTVCCTVANHRPMLPPHSTAAHNGCLAGRQTREQTPSFSFQPGRLTVCVWLEGKRVDKGLCIGGARAIAAVVLPTNAYNSGSSRYGQLRQQPQNSAPCMPLIHALLAHGTCNMLVSGCCCRHLHRAQAIGPRPHMSKARRGWETTEQTLLCRLQQSRSSRRWRTRPGHRQRTTWECEGWAGRWRYGGRPPAVTTPRCGATAHTRYCRFWHSDMPCSPEHAHTVALHSARRRAEVFHKAGEGAALEGQRIDGDGVAPGCGLCRQRRHPGRQGQGAARVVRV